MRRLLWVVPVAFFFLNPTFACGPAEPQYQYGAAEMRAAVEGNWSFTIMPQDGGAQTQVTVRVEQAATASGQTARAPGRAFVRAAYACGSRTLVKSAAACVDISQMPLTLTYVSGDAAFASAALTGTFLVYGTRFDFGNLELMVGPYQIVAQVGADRSLGDARVGPGGALGSLTVLTRS
jgi:hypothetical protein